MIRGLLPAAPIALLGLAPLLLPVTTPLERSLGLLLLVLVVPLLVIAAMVPRSFGLGRPVGVGAALVGLGLALVLALPRLELEALDVLPWLAGPAALSLAGLLAGRLLRLPRALILPAIGLPALATFLPFLLNSWLVRESDPEALRRGTEVAMALSSWTGATAELLGTDLFKHEALYREFLAGEQLYAAPKLHDALEAQILLACALLVIAGLGRLLRGLLPRLLPGTRGVASISTP